MPEDYVGRGILKAGVGGYLRSRSGDARLPKVREAAVPKVLEDSPFIRPYEPQGAEVDSVEAINAELDAILGNAPAPAGSTAEAEDIAGSPYGRATGDYKGIPEYARPDRGVAIQGPLATEGPRPEKKGIWAWKDSKGTLHQTNIESKVPEGVETKFYEERPEDASGGTLDAETAKSIRRQSAIKSLAEQADLPMEAAAKAYDERETAATGATPTAYQSQLQDYKTRVADRNKIMQNIQGLLRQAGSPGERNAIMAEGAQAIKSSGLGNLKPPEQTITATIEGQKVAIPVSKWKPEYGSGGTGKDTANIREATWLINNRIAKDEKEAYAMVRKATAKDTTEKEWSLDVRKRLNKKVDEGVLEADAYADAYKAEIDFFRGLSGGQPTSAIPEPAPAASTTALTPTGGQANMGPNKEAWLAAAQRRNPTASPELLERAYEKQLRG